MTNEEAVNVLRIMASGIELKGYTDIWMQSFKEAYELAIKTLEEKPKYFPPCEDCRTRPCTVAQEVFCCKECQSYEQCESACRMKGGKDDES